MIVSADYFANFGHIQRLLFVIDILILSLLYLFIGLFFSSVFDYGLTKQLDRDKSTLTIFFETVGAGLVTISAIYIILHFLPKLPSITKNPPLEHLEFRNRGADILLAFSIVTCQLRWLDKIRFLYNEEADDQEQINELVSFNYINCLEETGTPGDPPNEFSCA